MSKTSGRGEGFCRFLLGYVGALMDKRVTALYMGAVALPNGLRLSDAAPRHGLPDLRSSVVEHRVAAQQVRDDLRERFACVSGDGELDCSLDQQPQAVCAATTVKS